MFSVDFGRKTTVGKIGRKSVLVGFFNNIREGQTSIASNAIISTRESTGTADILGSILEWYFVFSEGFFVIEIRHDVMFRVQFMC